MAAVISIRNDRIKVLDIKDQDGNKLGELRFNPYDKAVFKKFWDIQQRTADGIRKYEGLVEEFGKLEAEDADKEKLEAEDSGKELFDSDDYERLNTKYRLGSQMVGSMVDFIDDLTKDLDSIFGEGVCDIFMQGYKDEGMLDPLIDAVMPYFEEAYKEQRKKVEEAKLNREQRRALKN